FPPGALSDGGLIAARDAGGAELPVHSEALLPWRAWPGTSMSGSVRSAMVSVQVTFASREPVTIQLAWGAAPGATLPAPADPRADWVAVTDGEYPAGTVREPAVYATFPVDWLSACLLRSRTTPVGADEGVAWLDRAVVGFAHTAVNDVPDSVVELLNYTTDAEPWLFDRTMTLFGVYARTGDVKWLRHAHRSAQFYLGQVSPSGYFILKGEDDLKYSYGRSLVTDYLFTGDPALLDAVDRIAAAGRTWDPTYDLDTNFWTERHQTYALLAALAAWESTGAEQHATRVTRIAEVSFALAADPVGSWPDNDCMLHGMTAHEGAGGDVPICSPWMSALFADAVFEYYIHSRDRAALEFLAGLGRYVRDHGLYAGGEGLDYTMPWYLSSSEMQFSDEGPWGDIEHTCDVGALVARAAWADAQIEGGESASLRAVADDLLTGCRYNLDMWHRPDAPETVGKSEWRLSPGRKFNWWFGTTTDLTWLLDAGP
ncbi:MAG TPA: hypothetical protein VFU21_09955, partial [Kofleriaceae bacterium]|nr:hypothetical protein [Kofleriaceae bacterium]